MVHRYWARLWGLTVDRSSTVECEAMVPLSQSSFMANRAKEDILSLQSWFNYCLSVSIMVSINIHKKHKQGNKKAYHLAQSQSYKQVRHLEASAVQRDKKAQDRGCCSWGEPQLIDSFRPESPQHPELFSLPVEIKKKKKTSCTAWFCHKKKISATDIMPVPPLWCL